MPSEDDRQGTAGLLAAAPLFQSLSEAEREGLAARAEVVDVERGGIIWLNGARADFFGLVVDGFVKMVKGAPGGQEMTAGIIGPNQVFGMLGVVDGQGCPLMARAVTRARFVKVPKSAFEPLHRDNAGVRDHVLRRSTGRLRQAFDAMALLSSGTVEQRLAAVLFTLAETYAESTGAGLRIGVPLTRQDMADLAGTTVETTIRVLSRWQAGGLVTTERRIVTLRDETALMAILTG